MKAAVTGATGFVGSHLVEELLARGDEPTVLARTPARAVSLPAGCRLVLGGLEDARALDRLVAGQEVVYHVAGVVAARDPREFALANRDGTARVAAAAARAGTRRLVLVSSLAVTGPSRPGERLDEASGPGPVTEYGRSKLAGEQAARESGVPLVIVRPPAVYGPRDRAFLVLFQSARRGLVPLPGDGRQELTLVHARDLAKGLVAAATSARTLGGTYHAGYAEPVTQRQLALAIGGALGRAVRLVTLPKALVAPVLGVAGRLARAIGRAPLLDADKCRELFAPGWACSSDALLRDAGWSARIPLAEGLAETAASYRARGWL